MKKLIWISFLLFSFSGKHPFYLSVTDLKYNAVEHAIQGSVKVFTNDLESALKRTYRQPVDLMHPKDSTKTATILKNYLEKHLVLSINGQNKTFDLLGFEREEEAVWMYIEIRNCPLPKTVIIENSILYEDLVSQSNIIHKIGRAHV